MTDLATACPECGGAGVLDEAPFVACLACDGHGYLREDGSPDTLDHEETIPGPDPRSRED